ncbi:hypothetical protein D043_0443A, partial [Vibrio parahaemolyticus EKP-021]
MGLLCPVQSL